MIEKIEKQERWKASDGKEFPTELAAESHDQLVVAKAEYDAAAKHYSQLLAQTMLTADGFAFEFSALRYYYIIRCSPDGVPQLQQIQFGRACEFDHQSDVIWYEKYGMPHNERHWIEYRISELYQEQKNAKVALRAALGQYIYEIKEESGVFETITD